MDWITEPETFGEKFREKGFAMAEAVDGFTSYVAVRSKYLQAIREGRGEAEAMNIADEFGRRMMGSRARGEKPMLFDTKNPFWQIATKFQLEVMNSWDHVTKDLPNDIKKTARTDGKAAAARKLAGRAARYEAHAFILNTAARALYGGSPAPFDLLGNALEGVAEAMGLTIGEALKTMLDDVLEAVLDERKFGTEDDDERKTDIGAGIKAFLGNTANDVPLVGRGAALMGIGDQTLPMADLSKVTDLGKSIEKNGVASADTTEAALNAASEFFYGGNQLRKTGQGLLAFGRGGAYSGDKLRYPVVQTPGNLVKGALFGKSSFGAADKFYAHGANTLTDRMTSAFELMVNEGADPETVYNAIQLIRKESSTREKMEALNSAAGLNDRQKWQMYTNIIADQGAKRPEQFRKMLVSGMSWSQISNTYLKYMAIDEAEDLGAREKATRFAAYLDHGELSEKQKKMVQDALKFYSHIPADAKTSGLVMPKLVP